MVAARGVGHGRIRSQREGVARGWGSGGGAGAHAQHTSHDVLPFVLMGAVVVGSLCLCQTDQDRHPPAPPVPPPQKHIDFALNSPFGGGRPGRVKRKSMASKGGNDGGEDEE